jgi:tripartite-type tricarboxylate transporter receptor subunit TctC
MDALRGLLRAVAALAALAAAGTPAGAQEWPTRPVSLVVPFAAGGPIDVVARLLGPRLSELIGQQVIVENTGGAGGTTGANRVAKSAPDGSMFLFGNQATHTFGQLMYKRPHYNATADFEPVSLVLSNVKVLVVRKDLPAKNLQEFVAYAKTNHAKMHFGSAGAGSATHMTCVLLNGAMGAPVTHVPYRGTALALQDLVAGRIDYLCDVISTALPHIRSGAVKPLALLSNNRSPVLPELPTALEQGLADVDGDGWNAFFFPKGTPQPIVRKLAAATSQTIDTPAIRDRIAALGLVLPGREQRGPEALARLVTSELKKWAGPVKASGISID